MATTHPVPTHPTFVDEEHDIVKRSILVAIIAIPIMVGLWVGLVALAVSFTTAGFAAPLAMAVGIGVLAGLFWACWYGFMAFAQYEEAERRTHHV